MSPSDFSEPTLPKQILPLGAVADILHGARSGHVGALDHHRGRSGLALAAQAADHSVRIHAGVIGLDDITVTSVDGADLDHPLRWDDDRREARCRVSHRDGRAWIVDVDRRPLPLARPESCGKQPVNSDVWIAQTPRTAPTA